MVWLLREKTWASSLFLGLALVPIADPMFPLGAGLVGLGFTPFLPVFPPLVYSILEGPALLLSIAWYWRLCKEHLEKVSSQGEQVPGRVQELSGRVQDSPLLYTLSGRVQDSPLLYTNEFQVF